MESLPAQVQLECPHCGSTVEISSDLLGRDVQCGACSKSFVAQLLQPTPEIQSTPPPVRRRAASPFAPGPPPFARQKWTRASGTQIDLILARVLGIIIAAVGLGGLGLGALGFLEGLTKPSYAMEGPVQMGIGLSTMLGGLVLLALGSIIYLLAEVVAGVRR